MSKASYPFSIFIAIAACGGSSRPPAKAPPPSPPQATETTTADPIPMCKRIFARKQTCADDYLPALLDVRVELNTPPGIGERVKTEGRDAILAIAHTELARDTEPSKVAELCQSTAAHMPPERAGQLIEQGAKCEAAADCKAFSACVVMIDRRFLAAGARQ